jgi:hypothetical protein
MNGASLPTVAYKTERELWSWHNTFQKEKIRIKTLSDNAMHAACHLFRSSMVRDRVTPEGRFPWFGRPTPCGSGDSPPVNGLEANAALAAGQQ